MERTITRSLPMLIVLGLVLVLDALGAIALAERATSASDRSVAFAPGSHHGAGEPASDVDSGRKDGPG
jgi:hypothetical protein